MQSQINKWGNSAAIRIPANILATMGLKVNSQVQIEVVDGKLVIEPVEASKTRLKFPFTEEDLLQNLTAHTAHADELATPIEKEFGDE